MLNMLLVFIIVFSGKGYCRQDEKDVTQRTSQGSVICNVVRIGTHL